MQIEIPLRDGEGFSYFIEQFLLSHQLLSVLDV